MKRTFLIGFGILLVFVILFMVFGRKYYTKIFSPEDHTEFVDGKFRALAFYNRPLKRGREIFGGLVPFGKVWRTGANEATWFETNLDLNFNNKILKAGRYSFWTIPNENSWTIIFNSVIPPWGIDYNSEAARNPDSDVLTVDVPVGQTETTTEQFTIVIKKLEAVYSIDLLWDNTIISVPFQINESSHK